MPTLSPVLAARPDTGQLQDRDLAMRSVALRQYAEGSSISGTMIRLRSKISASQVTTCVSFWCMLILR
jgi:hypothetical protein